MYAILDFVKSNLDAVILAKCFFDKKENQCYWPEESLNTFKKNKAVDINLDSTSKLETK